MANAAQALPDRYVQLGLRLGKHIDGLVDGYYGPPELKEAVDAEEPAAPEALQEEAAALLAEVAAWDDPDDARRRWLAAQVEGLVCVSDLVAGAEVSWRDAVRRCYGVDVDFVSEERFRAAHELLDAALPGNGDLAERLQAWNRAQEVRAEHVLPVFDALLARLREATAQLIDLPEGEHIEAEVVTEQPWSAYNWYLGACRSRIEINTDLPFRSYFLAELPAHEGYPGHHTEHACKEARLVRELGRVEHSILLIHTPECLVSEGIAQAGIEQALGEDWPTVAAELVRPLGVSFDAETVSIVREAQSQLEDVITNLAYSVGDRGWSIDDAVAYHQRWALSEEDRARKSVEFATHPVWGIYVPTYVYGHRLVKAFAAQTDDGFRRLLTEPVTTADLLEASVA